MTKLARFIAITLGTALLPACGNSGFSFATPSSVDAAFSQLTKETNIHTFGGSPDGNGPFAGLLAGKNGEFYGTTFIGGNAPSGGDGTVFEISSSGKEKVLYSFQGGSDALAPQAGLIADSAGDLFGDTDYGGGATACTSGCGAVFELTPTASGYSERVIYAFQGGKDGQSPI